MTKDIRKNARNRLELALDSNGKGQAVLMAVEAEQAVIGAILAEPKSMMVCVEQELEGRMFFNMANQDVYVAMQAISLNPVDDKIDPYTVYRMVLDGGNENSVTLSMISKMAMNVVSGQHISSHIAIIKEAWRKRVAYQAAEELKISIISGQDLNDAVGVFEMQATNVIQSSNMEMPTSYMALKIGTMERLKSRMANPPGYPTGISALDKKEFKFVGGEVTVIAGRPGSGKSTIAQVMSGTHGKIDNGDTIFFTLEMREEDLMDRETARISGVSNGKIRMGKFFNNDLDTIEQALADKNNDQPFAYYRKDGLFTLTKLRNYVKIWKAKGRKIKSIFIDYLQLMSVEEGSRFGNRATEIAYISRSLKQFALDEDIAIIALSQLNRNSASANKIPTISELRESGALEQDADNIILLCNLATMWPNLPADDPDYPNLPTVSKHSENIIHIDLAKRRGGAPFVVLQWCQFMYFRYRDIDSEHGEIGYTGNSFAPATNKQVIDSFNSKHEVPNLNSTQVAMPLDFGGIEDHFGKSGQSVSNDSVPF